MSKDYKVYHRYISNTPSIYEVTTTESTGSGELPGADTTAPLTPIYQTIDKTPEEVEAIFKEKYPLQYLYLKGKFNRKLRKLLAANEETTS